MPSASNPSAPSGPLASAGSGGAFKAWCDAQLSVEATALRRTRAGGVADGFDAADFAQADLLEVHFADGSVFYTDPQEFADSHPADGTTRGGLAEGGRVRLPYDLAGAAATTRGGPAVDGAAQVDQYRLARLTDPTTLDRLYDFGALFADGLDRWFGHNGAPGAGFLAAKICRAFERSQLHATLGDGHGSLLCWRGNGWEPLAPGALAGNVNEVLLFLHGTASSTEGSFGGLWWADEKSRPGEVSGDWRTLAAANPRRLVLGFEHCSLTVSPLRNVLDLLQQLGGLAPGATVQMVSHSRGGLVGELMAVALGDKADVVARAALLRPAFERAYGTDHPDRPLVDQFFALLGSDAWSPGWQPGTFVRVACPARGTLLADRRTDFFLSMLLRSVGLAFGGNGNPFYERLQGMVRALVAAKADAKRLPGLEAMIPGAPLSVALNSLPLSGPGSVTLPGRLRVVAGDSQGLGFAGILTLLGDVFYGLHDHDFVVHTHAMFGGLARSDARSLRVADKSVTHFGYFKPGSLTRGSLLAALRGEDLGFAPMAEDEARTRGLWQALFNEYSRWPRDKWLAVMQAPGAPRKPILVVLPGIMGSELAFSVQQAGDPVWLAPKAMLTGDLAALNLAGSRALEASGLMAVAYERLLARARDRFHVVTLPYDWRKPVPVAAAQLIDLLKALLPVAEGLNVPVHLLAHSMGGLVSRVALWCDDFGLAQRRGDLTAKLSARGLRLVQAGTPNRGSYAPVQLLMQQHSLSRTVAAMSSGVSAADLAAWGAAFPGLMTMLPDAADAQFGDLFDAATWQRVKQADASITTPDLAVLADAAKVRAWLRAKFNDLKANPQVFYVAGQGLTPLGMKVLGGSAQRPGVVRLGVSAQGDGTVPWDSTLAPERTWYTDCQHGDLLDHVDAFDGYFDLLLQGRTARLPQQRPATRGDDALANRLLEVPALPSLPADPAAYVLGVTQRSGGSGNVSPIVLRVVHGSLDYARFPLLAGHYQDDGIVGAVRRIDNKLRGQFRRTVDLKLFVGTELTSVYLRDAPPDGTAPAYPGAVLLGLGQVGALTSATLADTVTRGILRHAFEHQHQDRWSQGDGPLLLRLSTLLVGTHVQSVTVRDSLSSLLQGVWRAGQILAGDAAAGRGGAPGGRAVRIAELEVIEIDESVALDAAYELKRLLARNEWQGRYQWPQGTLEVRDGGIRGYRPGRNDSVWQRLSVHADRLGGLKFELIAGRARVESTQTHADVASLKQYIASVCDNGAASGGDGAAADEQAEFGRILFRLLLPQGLKTRLSNYEQTVLVLDDNAASLPWELMTPPQGEGAGGRSPQEAAQPLAVQAGMVRQRLTSDYRSMLPQANGGWGVLVVGAPATDNWLRADGRELVFPDLPGAEAEAGVVRHAFDTDARPWQVEPFEAGADFQRVYTTLLKRSWRVLHLAGHGMVDLWQRSVQDGDVKRELRGTGMVLSDQQMLTAGYVEQMDLAPEFVFINCCYSGKDGDVGGADAGRNLPVLASSLALQFIRMGTRAVVAAGWQVSDADGCDFAAALYGGLLKGRSFGEAVLDARSAVYANGRPRSNTWGAYQCYGDPTWRLVEDAPAGVVAADTDGMAGRLRAAKDCMSQRELAERIEQAVAGAGDSPAGVLEAALDDLVLSLRGDPQRQRWLRSTRVRAALGEAFRELGLHAKALTWLLRGMGTAYSKVEMRQLELAVNSMSRLNSPAGHAAAQDVLASLDRLQQAMAAERLGLEAEPDGEVAVNAASERECLRGSDRVRQAFQTTDTAKRADLLLKGAHSYVAGYVGKVDQADLPDRRAYALSNAMASAGLAALVDRSNLPSVRSLLRGAHAAASGPIDWSHDTDRLLDEIDGAGPAATFWHYTNALDLRLGRQVLRLALGEPVSADDLAEVDAGLQRALVRWPAPVEVESLASRIGQIGGVLSTVQAARGHATDLKRLRDAIEALRIRLRDHGQAGR